MGFISLPRVGGLLLILAASLSAQAPVSTETLLDRVAARLESFNPKSSWTASILSTQVEHDRKWQPERTTVQTKAVTVTDGRREEEIQKVVRTENGKTEDITEKYLAERRERWEKFRARREAEEREKPAAAKRPSLRGLHLEDFAELLPFSAERRTEFTFGVREENLPDGRRVYLLDVRAKVKDTMNWEGTYTIDAATHTPIHARLRPSDTPAFVKEIEVEADFEVLEDVNYIPLRTWVRINAGFLFIKRFRVISEEVYENIRISH